MCLIRKIKEAHQESVIRKKVAKMDDLQVDRTVRIQGTEFDRKRKLTDKQVSEMRKLFEEGFSIKQLASMFKVSRCAVRYNIDDEFRDSMIARNGKHTGETHMDFANRVEYKRGLVSSKKLKVSLV